MVNLTNNKHVGLYVVILSLLLSTRAFSQCAGTDNSVVICEKETDNNNQNFDLFTHLGGTPQTGGTWSSDNPVIKNALDEATGILNLWAINQFGEYIFTYTHPVCNESAKVTVFLGGYPGEDNVDGGANACSSNAAVDLFNFLDNNLTSLSADFNGTWSTTGTTPPAFVTENYFNAEAAGPGTYTLIYTVDAVDSCPARTATVVLEVHRKPEPGTPENIAICDTEDLSAYTNVNLFDYLTGEDDNGIWTDINQTGQITSNNDSTINIEEMYALLGPGEYRFEYTVYPTHGVCSKETSSVLVQIPSISAAFSVNNQCLENSLTIEIQHQRPNGVFMTYDLEYEIVNTNNQIVYTGTLNGIELADSSDVTTSPKIELPNTTLASGFYTIRVKTISNIDGIICSSFTIAEDSFLIYDTQINVTDICYETDIIEATLSNLIDSTGNLSNETLTVSYTITDLTNSQAITIDNQDISFNNGEGILALDLSGFPKEHSDYNLSIITTPESGLTCINYDFVARRVPDAIELGINVDNACNASSAEILINAPTLTNGEYTITYSVTNVDTNQVLISSTIISSGGSIPFTLDLSSLTNGMYEVKLQSSQDDTTPCRTETMFEVSEIISIGGIPDKPVLNPEQSFCLPDYQPNTPTISDILVDQGENLTWYESETSTTPLSTDTPLVSGEDYFVTATNTNNNCESSERASVAITFINPTPIASNNTSPLFCGSSSPTLANLDATANSGIVVWYDSATGGNTLNITTPLVNGVTYYAVENINGCEGLSRLSFTAAIISPPTPQLIGNTDLCALDKKTLLDFEASLADISEYQFIWYDAAQNGNELNTSDIIEENITYYVASFDEDSGCESERLPLTFSLSNCSPEDYDFFIPDGFSPNGDGVNDYYFIPHITYFYPEYTLEIFNRYGQLLFQGDKNSPKWDGRNKSSGNEVTSGVYFYILNFNKEDKQAKQGRIYLSK